MSRERIRYFSQTGQALDQLVAVVLRLERTPENISEVEHGTNLIRQIAEESAVQALTSLEQVARALQRLLGAVSSLREPVSDQTIDAVLRCIDFLRDGVALVRDGGDVPVPSVLLSDLDALTRTHASRLKSPSPQPSQVEIVTTSDRPRWTTPPAEQAPPVAAVALDHFRVTVTFEPNQSLADLKARLVLSRLGRIGDVVWSRPDVDHLEKVDGTGMLEVELQSDASADDIRAAACVDGVAACDVVGKTGPSPEDGPDREPPQGVENPAVSDGDSSGQETDCEELRTVEEGQAEGGSAVTALCAKVGQSVLLLPVEGVREVVPEAGSRSLTLRGNRFASLGGRMTLLINWQASLGWSPVSGVDSTNSVGFLVVLEGPGPPTALPVDEVLETVTLPVSAFSDSFVPLKGVLGTVALPDGTVGLVVDLGHVRSAALHIAERRFGS